MTQAITLRTGNLLHSLGPHSQELATGINKASHQSSAFELNDKESFKSNFGRNCQELNVKIFLSEHSVPEHIEDAVHQTLEDLSEDYINMLILSFDGLLSPTNKEYEGFWRAMEQCVRNGSVNKLGVADLDVKQLKTLLAFAEIAPDANQVADYRVAGKDLLHFCKANEVTLLAGTSQDRRGSATISQQTCSLLDSCPSAETALPLWAVRYSTFVRCTSVVFNKGYIVRCGTTEDASSDVEDSDGGDS